MGGGAGIPKGPQLSSDFIGDPNDPRIKGFDTSGQKQGMMRDFSRAGGDARAQTLASAAQGMGGSRSSATPGLLADIGAQQAYGQQKVTADLASKEYDQKLSLMDMLNNITQAANAAKGDQFNMNMGRRAYANREGRENAQAVTGMFGSVLGGMAGK